MPDGINYDAFSEALNDKADRDLQNVDTVSGGDAVIAFQRPTAENGYTWFRKYASGWVEQGGNLSVPSQLTGTVVNLPVTMSDTNYNILATINTLGTAWNSEFGMHAERTSTTTITLQHGSQQNPSYITWQVSGMAAQ